MPEIYLAPMAGYTDAAMREICLKEGAHTCITEMISAKALSYNNAKTFGLLNTGKEEPGVIVQIFGHEPDVMAYAAAAIEQRLKERLLGIDINMGCPMPKIVGNGDGCALMKDIGAAARIVAAVVGAVSCGVSIKIRKGFDASKTNAVEFAKMAANEGCSAITVHGRTGGQYYSGDADWEIIAEVKAASRIKVIGNGDIASAQDAQAMFAQTGCDAVMVGRAAVGNPFIFGEINAALTGAGYSKPALKARVNACIRHAEKTAEYKDGRTAMLQMRRIAPNYISGFKNSSKFRKVLSQISDIDGLKKILRDFCRAEQESGDC